MWGFFSSSPYDPLYKSLVSAATCVVTCFMNMVAQKASQECSADDLESIINVKGIISFTHTDVPDQSHHIQTNKHHIRYSASIFRKTPYGRQCYYVFWVDLVFELADPNTVEQKSFFLSIQNIIPVFCNISDPVQAQFCCMHVQMLLHIFELQILLPDNFSDIIVLSNWESKKQQKLMIQALIQSALQELCSEIENDRVIRNKLYNDFCDNLYKLQLNIDTCNRVEFDVLKERYQYDFYHVNEVEEHDLPRPELLPVEQYNYEEFYKIFIIQTHFDLKKDYNKLHKANYVRRYHKEFKDEVFIDKGGFGQVYKARHYLDGKEYAIKKISNEYFTKSQLNEIRVLAALNHPNIVPYNTAWIEPRTPYTSNKSSINRESSHTSKYHHNTTNTTSTNITEKKIIEEHYNEESSSDRVSFRNSKSNENLDYTIANTSISNSSLCEESSQEVNTSKNNLYTLYIQMALCEQTLEQWLRNERSVMRESIVKEIFQQIFSGVDYLHSKKIVHHDIKPSNIFISTSREDKTLRVQLGDFGLSCPENSLLVKEHSETFGTLVYTAPEQLEKKCDTKSDIYSVGVVLIESLIRIETKMELIHIIESLQSNKVPEALEQHKWAQMIMQMVQKDPINRPSASQLLQNFNHEDNK